MNNPVLTIGHSTRTLEAFIGILKDNGATMVVDIRTIPRSRHNPQFSGDTLPEALKADGIGYVHMKGLGGLRHPIPDSPNAGWHDASFRGFADYMQTSEFDENIMELINLARKKRIALMCAEAVPWRCHRLLIADALLVRGITVEHIISDTAHLPHEMTPWAKVNNAQIEYPA